MWISKVFLISNSWYLQNVRNLNLIIFYTPDTSREYLQNRYLWKPPIFMSYNLIIRLYLINLTAVLISYIQFTGNCLSDFFFQITETLPETIRNIQTAFFSPIVIYFIKQFCQIIHTYKINILFRWFLKNNFSAFFCLCKQLIKKSCVYTAEYKWGILRILVFIWYIFPYSITTFSAADTRSVFPLVIL